LGLGVGRGLQRLLQATDRDVRKLGPSRGEVELQATAVHSRTGGGDPKSMAVPLVLSDSESIPIHCSRRTPIRMMVPRHARRGWTALRYGEFIATTLEANLL
jgi:hypothetical protein